MDDYNRLATAIKSRVTVENDILIHRLYWVGEMLRLHCDKSLYYEYIKDSLEPIKLSIGTSTVFTCEHLELILSDLRWSGVISNNYLMFQNIIRPTFQFDILDKYIELSNMRKSHIELKMYEMIMDIHHNNIHIRHEYSPSKISLDPIPNGADYNIVLRGFLCYFICELCDISTRLPDIDLNVIEKILRSRTVLFT